MSCQSLLLDHSNLSQRDRSLNTGNRAMQTFISKASSSELDIIINEFKFHIQEILLDTHASHLLQILLQTASQQQRYTLFKSV